MGTHEQFVLARLAEEDILTDWAAAIAANVRMGMHDDALRGLACLWEDHPDYPEEWK